MFQKDKTVRFALPPSQERTSLHVAPLIDIVFLLICFYLFVAQLTSNQKDPTVELSSMSNPAIMQEAPAELVINLRLDGDITVGGRVMSLPSLRNLLAEQLDMSGTATLRVVIRADRRQSYGKLDELLEVCRSTGVDQVIFRSMEKEGS